MKKNIRPKTRGTWVATSVSVFALLLAGCSQDSATSVAPPSASSSSVAPTTTISASSSPTTPAQAEVHSFQAEPGLNILGHFLSDHPDYENDDAMVSGVGSFSIPGEDPVLVDAQMIFPDREVINQMYTSAGSAEKPLIVGAVQSRIAAQGLNEEKFETSVVALDPLTLEVLKEIKALSFEGWDKPAYALIGGVGNIVTLQHSEQASNIEEVAYADDILYATGYDVLTGERVWRDEVGRSYSQLGTLATTYLTGKVHGQYDHPCSVATVFDLATGKTLVSRDQLKLADYCGNSFNIEKLGSKYMLISIDKNSIEIDATTGEQVHFPYKFVQADDTHMIAAGWRGFEGGEEYTLDFMDMKTGKVLWTLAPTKVQNLEANLEALHDGIAYISTTDATISVDARTGKTIDDAVTEWPYASIDGWSYWTDGALTRSE